MTTQRRDSRGNRIGKRALNGPEGANEMGATLPKRVEAGLCPGLEAALNEVAHGAESFATTVELMGKEPGFNGMVGSSGVAAELRRLAEIARRGLGEWT